MAIVLCAELSERSKAELDELVVIGGYKGYSDAISVSIANQLLLQKQAAAGAGSFVVDSQKTPPFLNNNNLSNRSAATSVPVPSGATYGVPAAFSIKAAEACQSEAILPVDDAFVTGSKVTVDRWFFGQHNKLLPVKASCRALAVLLAERPLGVTLSEANHEIAKGAAELGSYLRQIDSRIGSMREDAFATAFPNAGQDSDRSRLRYSNQFIATLSAQGQLSGLLADLKLVNHLRGKEPVLLLTETGLRFAKLSNPILDAPVGSNSLPNRRFSESEIQCLSEHIRHSVPVEDAAIRTVLRAILDGANTPESLDNHLRKEVPAKKSISDAFVSTQRSGAISRMSDIDMVLRRRDGVRVKYEITQRAQAYLKS